jgi:hypothetical protein
MATTMLDAMTPEEERSLFAEFPLGTLINAFIELLATVVIRVDKPGSKRKK